MARRDEVWERKRQNFLCRQNGSGGADHGGLFGAPAAGAGPAQRPGLVSTSLCDREDPPMVTSPLSKLVKEGYPETVASMQAPSPRQALGMQAYAQGGSRPGSRQHQDGFSGGVAQQWSHNVQNNLAAHQQQHDPNYGGPKKPSGFRVTQAPGGGSSISLSWGGDVGSGGGAAQAAAGVCAPSPGMRAPSPGGRRMQASSPSGAAGDPRQRGALPPYGSSTALPNGSYDSYGSSAAPSYACSAAQPYGSSAVQQSGGAFPPPLPRQSAPQQYAEPTSLAFGARNDKSNYSSNAYASGSNQNCGNFVTDRRTTRVLQPPGGGSNFSLG